MANMNLYYEISGQSIDEATDSSLNSHREEVMQ